MRPSRGCRVDPDFPNRGCRTDGTNGDTPGFQASLGAERTETDPPADVAPASAPEASDQNPVEELVTPDMIDMKAPATAAARRPTKFMADLSRAMQAAAESSRDETMARLSAEAKTVVEEIQQPRPRRAPPAPPGRRRRRRRARMVEGRDRPDPRGDRGSHRDPQDGPRWRDGGARPRRGSARPAGRRDRLRLRSPDGRVLPAPSGRGRPDPHRDHGRDHARFARPGQHRRVDRGAAGRAVRSGRGPPGPHPGRRGARIREAAPEGGDAAPDFAAAEAEALAYTGDAEVDGDGAASSANLPKRP